MKVYSLQSLFTLRALWSGCCHVVVWTILTPSTVSTLSHCLSTSRRVESAQGTGLRGDRSHWTVESLGTHCTSVVDHWTEGRITVIALGAGFTRRLYWLILMMKNSWDNVIQKTQ